MQIYLVELISRENEKRKAEVNIFFAKYLLLRKLGKLPEEQKELKS